MKKLFIIISALFFAIAVHATESETVKGAKKDVESFKKEMNVKLQIAETKIAELKSKAADKSSKAKTTTIAELEASRDAIKAKMATLSENSKESWASMKKSMADSVNSLNAKVQNALKE
jgi:hypothetical protein